MRANAASLNSGLKLERCIQLSPSSEEPYLTLARIYVEQKNYDKARASAAEFRDILGKENYFLELMDHGLSIETRVREVAREVFTANPERPPELEQALSFQNTAERADHDLGRRASMAVQNGVRPRNRTGPRKRSEGRFVRAGFGEPGETRTPNQLIKSQLLCH